MICFVGTSDVIFNGGENQVYYLHPREKKGCTEKRLVKGKEGTKGLGRDQEERESLRINKRK